MCGCDWQGEQSSLHQLFEPRSGERVGPLVPSALIQLAVSLPKFKVNDAPGSSVADPEPDL